MKKIRPYLLGMLLAWSVMIIAACGSTDNGSATSETSEGSMTQTTQEETSSERDGAGKDETDGREESTGVIDGAMEDMRDAIDDGIGEVERK